MNKKVVLIASAIILVLGFIGGAALYVKNTNDQLEKISETRNDVFVRGHSPIYGNENAQVTVTEFLDPECESCRAFYPYVKDLIDSYDGKVRLVLRYVPYHGNSKLVIKILEASKNQDLYWKTLTLLFEHQPQWGDHHNPRPDLIWELLPSVGLDVDKIREDINDPAYEKIIEQDFNDAKELGVRGTPTFFVDGKAPSNFGIEYVKKLIDQQLNK